ncbi:hypothetical protein HK100_009781, partial [Physocladia obscura]
MGPHVSRMLKEKPVSKTLITSSTPIDTPLATAESSESLDAQTISLVATLDGVDFTREYHGVEDSDYFLPSDVGEQDRLELQVLCCDIVRDDIKKLAATPGYKILDVGCANGYWLDSIAKTYLSAELHGVDLAPAVIEKAAKFLPSASFTAGNVITGLPFEDNTFDYVHQRYLILGLPKHQFAVAIRELMRVTKPGGWIELVETDAVAYRGGPTADVLVGAIKKAMAPRKLDFLAGTNLVNHVKLALQTTKYTVAKLQKRTVSMPQNWGGPIGDMAAVDGRQLYLSMEDFLHKILGVEREEYRELVEKMLEESKAFKTYG